MFDRQFMNNPMVERINGILEQNGWTIEWVPPLTIPASPTTEQGKAIMISMDKKYRTRNGSEFIIGAIRTDGVNPGHAVIGWADDGFGKMVAARRRIDGSNPGYNIGVPSQDDLIEVVPDVVSWVNVYPNRCAPVAINSRVQADNMAGSARIAIVKITTKNGGVNGASDVSVEVILVGARD